MPASTPVEVFPATNLLLQTTSTAVVTTAAVPQGSTIFVVMSASRDKQPTFSDAKSNTYTKDADDHSTAARSTYVASAPVATALALGDTVTVTHGVITSATINVAVYYIATGITATPFDQAVIGSSATTAVSTGPTGTLAAANGVAWCVVACGTGSRTMSTGTGWSRPTTPDSTGTAPTLSVEYQIPSSTAALTGTGTMSGAGNTNSQVVVYKGVPSGGSTMMLMGVG